MRRTVKIIKRLAPDQLLTECAFCGGKGTSNGFESHVACRVCRGRGLLIVEGREPLVACERCEGLGCAPGEEWYVVCPSCQGTGAQGYGGRRIRILERWVQVQ